ncbi:hypothetical protein [Xanthomonas sp. XNM01]|uniref:hypothetical protein n=1 Tax=Xanthomonas sp. XNM01 TaxID=2769289 RepID=UPI0017875B01|nr:hypothetical protein [Xanthomonas sp. XNM01]MBD9368378.1 hypothetical protein [Xanthomonas sp. XNM01]
MEREEPRISAPDLSDLDFRRGESRIVATPVQPALWPQIAAGVFLALLAHSIVTGLYVRWEAKRVTDELNAQMAKETAALERQLRDIEVQIPSPQAVRQRERPIPPAPLQDGERCIKGQRFQRVENGWVHVPRLPC